MKDWLSLASSIDKVRTNYLIAIACGCLFLLMGPTELLRALALLQIVAPIKSWLGIALFLSICLLIARIAGRLQHFCEHQLRLARLKRIVNRLTGEELGFLGEFILTDCASIQAPLGDGLAGALRANNLIFQASSIGHPFSGLPYGIQPLVKDYLRSKPDLWTAHAERRIAGKQNRINQFQL